jgi:hypothetical protein
MRQTSIDAYHRIESSGILSQRRWEAYRELFMNGPLTGKELERNTRTAGMWKRCSELERIGCVYNTGVRTCTVTGEDAIAWDVNAFVPTTIPPMTKPKSPPMQMQPFPP